MKLLKETVYQDLFNQVSIDLGEVVKENAWHTFWSQTWSVLSLQIDNGVWVPIVRTISDDFDYDGWDLF